MKISVPACIARSAAFLAVLASFAVGLHRPVAAQGHGLPASGETITQLVADGRNLDAVDMMKTTFDATPPAARQAFFVFAAGMCVALSDIDCATHFLTHDSVTDMKVGDVHSSVIGYRSLLAWYVGIMGGSPPPREHVFDRGFPVNVINPINSPVLFAEFQLLAARQFRLVFDFEASRDHVDRALASVLVLQDERFDAPRLLVRIAAQLLDNDEVERALRLVAAAEPVLQSIPPDSRLNFDVLQLRARLNGYRKDFATASRDLRLAIAVLDRLQLKPELAAHLRTVTYNDLLGMEALRGDRAAVENLLRSHPLLGAKPEILKRGYFANEPEFRFAVTEELVRLFLNDRSDTGWNDLLKTPPKWTADPERLAEVRAFAQAAIGLQLTRTGKIEARREFIEAARTRLGTLQQRRRQSTHAAPLPYWTDQLLLEFALSATLTEATPDYELVLGAHIVINRSLETGPDDALASQAIQASDEGKRAVQASHAIGYQRTAWEMTQLAALARRLSSHVTDRTPSDATFRQRYDVIHTASDFTDYQQRLRAALSIETSRQIASSGTGLATLRELLLPDEALVFHVPMLDHTGKICVRSDRVASSLQRARDSDATDVRLLAAALTADHPTSIEADSQYPADAAVRLGKLLFGGLEDCLRTARRVYHIAGGVLAQIPPAALLAEVPPRLGAGYDLRRARWLVLDHSFIKTSSIDSFVATRKLSKQKRAILDYLGVGDPVLAAPTNPLADLAELPETSEELQRVGRLFEKSKVRILRREAASEENFRLQPLSEFDVMHFATHGLMREEVPGLPEPSLVLTPDPKGDAFNDGLLTTSQIAALSLRTRLVVLSACNSARYEASIVESGIQGLSTAFTIAGVPSTIAALWPIESSLTRDLIIATFRAARGDSAMPLADALATAMRRHLEGPTPRPLLHPRYWSALVVLGDGSMTLGATGQGAQRDLAAFAEVDTAESEEILSAATVDGEDVATSTIGPWNGKRSPSLIRRHRPDGTTQWEVSDLEIGAGPTAAIGQAIYAAGYVTVPTAASDISVPVLRQLGPDGKVLWTRRLPSAGNASSTMVMAVGATHDRMALALVGPTRVRSTGAEHYIIRIDATGVEAGRTALEFSGNAAFRPFGVLAGDGTTRVAILNRSPIPGDRVGHVNGYGLPQICLEGDAADIVFFDVDAMQESRRSSIDRFNASSAVAVEGGWLVVGSVRGGCGIDARAAAFMVKADGTVQEMWRDRSPFVTNGQGVRRSGSGFEIVGRSRRSVAIREGRPTIAMPDFSSLRMGDEAYVSDELFSVRLSEQGKQESTDFVAAGLPIIPMGMVSTATGSVIHGTIGSRPLWISR